MCGICRGLAIWLLLWGAGCGVGGGTRHPRRVPSGYLMVSVRAEPLTWNRLLATDLVSHVISERIHAALVRVNRETQRVEPELAESWSFSEDGKTLTFRLRSAVRFSDGTPFTAEDVAFTFRAIHDPRVASPLVETATVEGKALLAEVVDPLTVRFRLPRRTAVVERLFDSFYILPRHRLEAALEAGNFAAEYGVATAVNRVVGLGPFVLDRYLPGQRVVLRRNPFYWKKGSHGETLPLLDGIVFEILLDSNARMLKFLAGDLDLDEGLLPEDFVSLRDRARPDPRLLDLGPGMVSERLWFNLNPGSPTLRDQKRRWFEDVRFRRAVSLAVDRSSIVEGVYRGLASPAVGPVSLANRVWRNEAIEPPRRDIKEARRLLHETGFRWSQDGRLEDPNGRPVRFTLVTTVDNPHRSNMALMIQEDLARLGMDVSVVRLDFASVIERFTRSFEYDACLFGFSFTDPDPSAELPLWLSRSPHHVWCPSQIRPATPWEARVDMLMGQQMVALEPASRKALFDEVQAIVARELPLIDLVVPHLLIGASRRVGNLKPVPVYHPTLWNSEELFVKAEVDRSH